MTFVTMKNDWQYKDADSPRWKSAVVRLIQYSNWEFVAYDYN